MSFNWTITVSPCTGANDFDRISPAQALDLSTILWVFISSIPNSSCWSRLHRESVLGHRLFNL